MIIRIKFITADGCITINKNRHRHKIPRTIGRRIYIPITEDSINMKITALERRYEFSHTERILENRFPHDKFKMAVYREIYKP